MSRETILNKLRVHKPAASGDLPEMEGFPDESRDFRVSFIKALENNGAAVIQMMPAQDLESIISRHFMGAGQIVSTVPGVSSTIDEALMVEPGALAGTAVAVVRGELGVAENGAIWVSDRVLPWRVLPFITRHLVIVVEARDLVGKMHQAYAAIDPEGLGFGVFISGPSKTGDIEQALVQGAHGPLGLTVILRC